MAAVTIFSEFGAPQNKVFHCFHCFSIYLPWSDGTGCLPPTLHQATANPCLCWRLLDTHRQVWVSLLWGRCSFLLGTGAHGSVCALQESISQSCVTSGCSVVGLMAISSKRAYAMPRSAVPVSAAAHCWPTPPQEMLRDSSVSVSMRSLSPGVHKVCLSPLNVSGGNGVWF